jgi:hypothetical protein
MAAHGHEETHQQDLDPIVRDVLRERETTIEEKGRIHQRRRLMPLSTRLSFLTMFLSGKEFDRSTQLWQDLQKAIDLRDSCVHPKPPLPWNTEPEAAREVINTIGAVLTEIHRLMDLQPQDWWADADYLLTVLDDQNG